MKRLIGSTTLLILALLSASGHAQNGFNLPYSQFGIGSAPSAYSTPLSGAMGGTLYSTRSNNYVNPYNPASYAAVESQTFVLDIGTTMQRYTVSDNLNSMNDFDGNLSHLTFAFPLTSWWKTAIGLTPYSDMEYASTRITTLADGMQVKTVYDGNGEVFRVFWGNGFNINKKLSIGFNLNYLHGNINRAITFDFLGSDTNYYVDSRRLKNTHVSSVYFDLGTQYVMELSERDQLIFGLSLQLPRTLTTHDTAWIYTLAENSDNASSIIDTSHYTSDAELPVGIGLGVSYQHDQRWQLSADLHYAPWNGMKYKEGLSQPVFPESGVDYVDNFTAAIGGAWLGDASSSNYWRRIGIYVGAHYDIGRLGLTLDSGKERIDEWGAGLSLAFPIRKGRSRILLSAAYSNMGTRDLMRVECLSFGITLSSCEQWFIKRQYN